ncbi:ABC transporter substrate-binding protein [Salinifilum aidingensis]
MHCLRRRVGLPALALVTALLAGCGFTGAGGEGNALHAAIGIPPRSGWSPASDDAILLTQLGVTESLTEVDLRGRAHPELAESWQRSGEREWRFTLAGGVRFHSGEPLTAQAAARSLNNVAHASTPPRTMRGIVSGAEAAGPRTLVVRTEVPDPILPLRLGGPNAAILAPAAFQGNDGVDVGAGVGTGPFEITSVHGAKSVELRRFDEYRGSKAELDRAEVRFVEDPSARLNGLRSGEFDVIDKLPVSQAEEVSADPDLRESTVDLPRTTALHVNTQRGPFADERVRRAAARAVDRPALVDGVLRGRGVPAQRYFGPAVPWSSGERPGGAAPQQARRMLAEATGQQRPSVTIGTYPERPDLPAVTTAVADQLKKAGFDVRIVQAPSTELEERMLSGELDGLVYSRNYLVDTPDASSYLRSDFTCDGSLNLDHFCAPELERINEALRTVSDPARRAELFREADAVLAENQVGIPLFHEQAQIAHRAGVRGLPADPLEQELLTEEVSVS